MPINSLTDILVFNYTYIKYLQMNYATVDDKTHYINIRLIIILLNSELIIAKNKNNINLIILKHYKLL